MRPLRYLTAPLALGEAPSLRLSGLGFGSGMRVLAFCCFCMAANLLVFTNPMSHPLQQFAEALLQELQLIPFAMRFCAGDEAFKTVDRLDVVVSLR